MGKVSHLFYEPPTWRLIIMSKIKLPKHIVESNFGSVPKEYEAFVYRFTNLDDNKKYVGYSAILVAGILYVNPIVTYTSSSVSCIDKTTKYIKANNINKSQSEMDINSLAVGYCHGGTLPK